MKDIYNKFIIFTIGTFIIMGNASTIDLSAGMLYKGLPIKITDIFFLLIVLKNFSLIIKKPKLKDNLLIIWIIWGIISIFFNFYIYNYEVSEIRYGILYPIRMIIYILGVNCIVSNLKKRFSFRKIMNKINFYYTIACLIGLFQYIVYPVAFDFYRVLKNLNIYILNPDPHYNRLFGTYLDPNFLGSILVFPVGITLSEIFVSKNKKRKLIKIIQLIFQMVIIILTASRSGILGIALLLIVFFSLDVINIKYRMKKLFFNLFIGGGLILSIITLLTYDKIRVFKRIIEYKEDPSAQARFSSFSTAVNQIVDNFFIGTGYNMMGFYSGNSNLITGFGTNSSWQFIFITTGIIGILIFVLYLFRNIYKVYLYRNKKNYFYANSLIAITLASAVTTNFNNLLVYPLWIVIYIFMNEIYFGTQQNKKRGISNV